MAPGRRLPVAASAVLLALTGCATTSDDAGPVSPSPSVSDSPSSSPGSDPLPGAVVVSGAGVSIVDADDLVVSSATFAGGSAAAVSMLSAAFGEEPTHDSTADAYGGAGCEAWSWPASSAEDSWRDAAVFVRDCKPHESAPFPDFQIEVTSPEYSGHAIRTVTGAAVGDSRDSVIGGLPADQIAEWGGIVDSQGIIDGGNGAAPFGVLVVTDADTVTTFWSPDNLGGVFRD